MLWQGEIEAQIAYMVENCKLAPEADASWHTIIANLGQGVEAAQGKHGESGVPKGGQGRPGCQCLRQVF